MGPHDDIADHVDVYHGNAHENEIGMRDPGLPPRDVEDIHDEDHEEFGEHGSGKRHSPFAWEKEGTSKTASWIIVNEKSKRRVAGPFQTVSEAQDKLKALGEGYELEQESEGKEASRRPKDNRPPNRSLEDIAGEMGPNGEIEKEGTSLHEVDDHYRLYGEPPARRSPAPFDWDNYHAQVKAHGHAEGPLDWRGEPNWNAYDRHVSTCPTCGR